jgi:hypothetical protein
MKRKIHDSPTHLRYKYMKELLKQIKSFKDGWGIQKLFDPDFEGSCPCFCGKVKVDGKTLRVWGRCWRVSKNDQDLHIGGTLSKEDLLVIGTAIKKALDKQNWHNPYTLIIHGKNWSEMS